MGLVFSGRLGVRTVSKQVNVVKRSQIIVLIFFIMASLSVVIFGIMGEAGIGSAGFNGAPYHIFVIPFLPLTGGLVVRLKISSSFLPGFLLSWSASTMLFLTTAWLGMFHYGFDWQPEWFWFWVAMSAALFILEGIVHFVGKLTGGGS